MQGQKGAIGSLPETLTLEHGSTSSDSGVVEQQICWTNFIRNPSANANQEAQNISVWCMGESSSSSLPNHASQNRVDPITEHGRSSLMKTCSEPHQHEPPTSMLSLGDVNMNLTHNHTNNGHHNGPLFAQNSRSEPVPQNVTVNPSTFIGIKPSNYASSSSDPFEIENRQLPCKRRATELSIGQSSSGIESLNIFQRPVSENPPPLNTMVSEQIIPRISSGVGLSSDNHSAESSHRNVRIRINSSSLQDPLPASNISNNGQLNFLSPYSSLGLNPVVATTGENSISSSHEGQPRLRVPVLRRNLQVSSRNRSSSSRANRSMSLNIGGSGDNSRTMPINISDHPLFVQPHDIRNTTQAPVNWNSNSSGGNGNLINAVPSLGPHRGSSQYPYRRLSEILRRSVLSSTDSESRGSGGGGGGDQSSNLFSRIPPPVGSTSASSSQETGIPPVIGIPGSGYHHHLPHLRSLDRHVDGALGFPYLARTVAGGSERRGRLVSEIRNVLDLIRRGEGLRFEDVMILDQSVFYGMPDIHDRHRDMRLDIDNMSYEELLALEERIGNVNTGLTEENISKCLKHKSYTSVAGQIDVEPCCICQEEYNNGDDMGVLECGHDFHTSCIKQWLLQKNLCPVCKSSASK